MRHSLALILSAAFTAALPAAAGAQEARDIMETMQQKQLERWDGVDAYIIRQTMMGHTAPTVMVRTIFEDANGNEQTTFMPASPTAVQSGQCVGPQRMTPEDLENFATGMEMTGEAMGGEIEDGLEEAGLPRGMLAATGSSPTATLDPRVMMGANAEFMRAAADAQRAEADRPEQDRQEAARAAEQMAQVMEKSRVVGRETIDGREAFHVRAEGLDQVQEMDGREYRMDAMSVWVDTEHYVTLQMKVDGTLTSGNETRPMTIESRQTDYRNVPGSKLYEPYRTVTKIAGALDPEQEAQLAEAQAEMAKMEQQLASMPEGQRKMMEQMMGPQLEAMRNMGAGGGFRMEMTVASIDVNPPEALAPEFGGTCTGNADYLQTAPTVAAEAMGIPASAMPAAATPAADRAELEAAQDACLERKIAAARESQKKKRGFGKLLSGIGRAASGFGADDVAAGVAQTRRDVYDANATASDLSAAAKDLGLTESDIEACRNPT